MELGAGLVDVLKTEGFYHLVHGDDLLILGISPAQERQEIHEGFWQVAFFLVLEDRDVAVPFGELAAAARLQDYRKVREGGGSPAEGVVKADVFRRGRDPLVAAHDVRDAH